MADDVDPEVRAFLHEHVRTYERLEVLLLLCRERHHPWSPEAVGEKLRLSTLVATKALDDLTQARLLDHLRVGRASTFTFRPGSSRVAALVESLLRSYDDNPLTVIHLMNTNALDRVRSAAARTFADAFVINPKGK